MAALSSSSATCQVIVSDSSEHVRSRTYGNQEITFGICAPEVYRLGQPQLRRAESKKKNFSIRSDASKNLRCVTGLNESNECHAAERLCLS